MGMPVHNVELVPGKGGQICRSAGCMATIVNKQTEQAIVRLPSGVNALSWGGQGRGGGQQLGRWAGWPVCVCVWAGCGCMPQCPSCKSYMPLVDGQHSCMLWSFLEEHSSQLC